MSASRVRTWTNDHSQVFTFITSDRVTRPFRTCWETKRSFYESENVDIELIFGYTSTLILEREITFARSAIFIPGHDHGMWCWLWHFTVLSHLGSWSCFLFLTESHPTHPHMHTREHTRITVTSLTFTAQVVSVRRSTLQLCTDLCLLSRVRAFEIHDDYAIKGSYQPMQLQTFKEHTSRFEICLSTHSGEWSCSVIPRYMEAKLIQKRRPNHVNTFDCLSVETLNKRPEKVAQKPVLWVFQRPHMIRSHLSCRLIRIHGWHLLLQCLRLLCECCNLVSAHRVVRTGSRRFQPGSNRASLPETAFGQERHTYWYLPTGHKYLDLSAHCSVRLSVAFHSLGVCLAWLHNKKSSLFTKISLFASEIMCGKLKRQLGVPSQFASRLKMH